MIQKAGSTKECNNYRIIALTIRASKILLIIILNRMKFLIKNEPSGCQVGYRQDRGTRDGDRGTRDRDRGSSYYKYCLTELRIAMSSLPL